MTSGYVGKIKNTGAQFVKAPNQSKVGGKQPSVQGMDGSDLRAAKNTKLSKK